MHFPARFIFCPPTGTSSQHPAGVFRGDEPPGGPPRMRCFLLPVSRTWNLHRQLRWPGWKAGPLSSLSFPMGGVGPRITGDASDTRGAPSPGTQGVATEDNHRARTCNFSCSSTEGSAGRRSLPSRAEQDARALVPHEEGAGGHVGATSAAYCRARLRQSSRAPPPAPRELFARPLRSPEHCPRTVSPCPTEGSRTVSTLQRLELSDCIGGLA